MPQSPRLQGAGRTRAGNAPRRLHQSTCSLALQRGATPKSHRCVQCNLPQDPGMNKCKGRPSSKFCLLNLSNAWE